MVDPVDGFIKRCQVERDEKWKECIDQIPYLKFDPGWEVQIIPPFGGAMARFRVRKNDDDWLSIYLDFYDNLGCVGQPYREVYPVGGDTYRCMMNDTDELLDVIRKTLDG